MGTYLLAHDLGTSGDKATLYDCNGNLKASVLCEYKTYYPHAGWAEQNPCDWWQAVCKSTKELIKISNIQKNEIASICFSGQMMGCLLVDNKGNALRTAIIWADNRSTKQADEMIKKIGMDRGYHITGHRLSASYSATKLMWIRENQPEIYQKAYKLLNAKDYIIYKLTGAFVTDYSDASGTNLLDINTKCWSYEILQSLGIRTDILPELHASTHIAGKVTVHAALECGLLAGTPVVLGGGDGSCACVGAGVVEEGKTYNVLGTSSWMSTVSKHPIYDPQMRTFNWIHLDSNLYTPCGTMQAAGSSLNWLKETLCQDEINTAKLQNISPYQLIDRKISQSIPGARGLLYLPYLLGERSPRWNFNARGAFIGLHIRTKKEDICRAVLEGIGYNLKVILDILNEFYSIDEVILIGGGAKSEIWQQILADIWQKPLFIPEYIDEATSMGAAVCGGVGIGLFSDFKVINKFNPLVKKVTPRSECQQCYNILYKAFNQAYNGLLDCYNTLSTINSWEFL